MDSLKNLSAKTVRSALNNECFEALLKQEYVYAITFCSCCYHICSTEEGAKNFLKDLKSGKSRALRYLSLVEKSNSADATIIKVPIYGRLSPILYVRCSMDSIPFITSSEDTFRVYMEALKKILIFVEPTKCIKYLDQ